MDSHNGRITRVKLFGGGSSIHAALGGGKVADLLLWKEKKVSAAVLAGVAFVWFLFEVVEYNFITLLCHITITTMLVLFSWGSIAHTLKWTRPQIPRIILQDSAVNDIASILQSKLDQFLDTLCYVASGNEPKLFFLAICSLWMISMIGNYVSTLNLVFFGLLCLQALPFLYERYEEEVDDLASKIYTEMVRAYKKFETEVLGKIPRAGLKDKDT